jgi:hypothetical protein
VAFFQASRAFLKIIVFYKQDWVFLAFLTLSLGKKARQREAISPPGPCCEGF